MRLSIETTACAGVSGGGEFNTMFLEDYELIINGISVPTSSLNIIDPHMLTADFTLTDGRNDVSLKAVRNGGYSIYYEATLWAGDNTVTVSLVNPDGTPFTTGTRVVAWVADDPSVTVQLNTATGVVTLHNVPDRTILIEARGIGNELGTAGILGNQNSVTIEMKGIGAPSKIKNLDFSQGKR